jgi:hypothetical protein
MSLSGSGDSTIHVVESLKLRQLLMTSGRTRLAGLRSSLQKLSPLGGCARIQQHKAPTQPILLHLPLHLIILCISTLLLQIVLVCEPARKAASSASRSKCRTKTGVLFALESTNMDKYAVLHWIRQEQISLLKTLLTWHSTQI